MKKLLCIAFAAALFGCNDNPYEGKIVLENRSVEFDRFDSAMATYRTSSEVEEDSIDFPSYVENCTVVTDKINVDLTDEYSHYWIDGSVSIYNSKNELVAEWTYDSYRGCYSNLRFYKTENGTTYCFIECLGEFEDGYEGGCMSNNFTRKRFQLDNNGNRFLYSVAVVNITPYRDAAQEKIQYKRFDNEGNVILEKEMRDVFEYL